jgi:biopolymer transport protein ExbD
MFIITIPVATHSVNIDLPAPADNPPPVTIDPVRNKVVITKDDKVMWNETELKDNRELISLLLDSGKMRPEPELQFQPDANARYELSAKVLTIIKGSGITKFGFVGNELYSAFGKAANAE